MRLVWTTLDGYICFDEMKLRGARESKVTAMSQPVRQHPTSISDDLHSSNGTVCLGSFCTPAFECTNPMPKGKRV